MAGIQMLRIQINERLATVAEEIFDIFESTLIRYENEINRQRKLLENRSKGTPESWQARACVEEVPPQQERRPSAGQGSADPPKIKEEPQKLWSRQEGEHLPLPEEADIIEFTFTPSVTVKTEIDDKEQESQLGQSQEESSVPSTSSQQAGAPAAELGLGFSELDMTPDPATAVPIASDCEIVSSDCSDAESEDDKQWSWRRKYQSSSNTLPPLKTLKANGQTVSSGDKLRSCMEPSQDLTATDQVKLASCFNVGGNSGLNNTSSSSTSSSNIKSHCLSGTDLDPTEDSNPHPQDRRSCEVCGKTFSKRKNLLQHKKTHTDEKPYSCSLCEKRFNKKWNLNMHMKTHTGERPFDCSVCGKEFRHNGHLKAHMKTHTGEKPYGCSVCGKAFRLSGDLTVHMRIHTGEKPYSCKICKKRFAHGVTLARHMGVHAEAT